MDILRTKSTHPITLNPLYTLHIQHRLILLCVLHSKHGALTALEPVGAYTACMTRFKRVLF